MREQWAEERRVIAAGNGGMVHVATRDPARPPWAPLGAEGEKVHPIFVKVVSLAKDVFAQLGPGCSERDYKEAIANSPWFSANNVTCVMEHRIDINHYFRTPINWVDLLVDGRYVFELKIHAFTKYRLERDREVQLDKYLQAFAFNKHTIHCAALIYFTPTGVEDEEVDCHWIFPDRDRISSDLEPSLEESFQHLSLGLAEA